MELVLFRGMGNIEEIVGYIGKRKDNLYKRVIGPVIWMSLLETDGETLRIPEDSEAVLHKVFVESGGEEALSRTREKFDRDRDDYCKKGEKANEIQIPDFLIPGRLGATGR